MYREENISTPDRLISAGTYITGGTIGVLWLIFCALTRKGMTKFLMANIYQSVFLALFYFIARILLISIYNILIMIPVVKIVANIIYLALFAPIYYQVSIMNIIIFAVLAYLVISSLFGKIGKLPWVSDIIAYHINRY